MGERRVRKVLLVGTGILKVKTDKIDHMQTVVFYKEV